MRTDQKYNTVKKQNKIKFNNRNDNNQTKIIEIYNTIIIITRDTKRFRLLVIFNTQKTNGDDLVLQCNIGAVVQQQSHDKMMPLHRSTMQRGITILQEIPLLVKIEQQVRSFGVPGLLTCKIMHVLTSG